MQQENGITSNIYLTGSILLAHIDVGGLLDYGIKAFIGGGIWLAFKILSDKYSSNKKGL
jgi:hypothetical protein